MKLVLVGDDGSDAAAQAMDWAIRFAGERQAEATAVHASRTGSSSRGESRLACVTVSDAHPASAIIETAEDLDADLIVLGRRGTGGFPSLPIGTTAHVVAAASGRPVVIVPPAYTGGEPLVRSVVVGFDGLPGSAEAAEWATRVCPTATFTAVHALELAPAFVGLEGDEDLRLYERAHERAVTLMSDWWCRPLTDAGVELDIVIEEGGPAEVLLNVAARAKADLVVVSRRDHQLLRGTLGSVSQRILAYSPCPAVIVPLP